LEGLGVAKLSAGDVVSVSSLVQRGVSNVEIARLLGVSEGAVRYQRKRLEAGAVDGRSKQVFLAEAFRPAIEEYLRAGQEESPSNVKVLHEHLVAEHDYPGSLRNLQRYVRSAFPAPAFRARRRVETPPGAQAQADWAHFPGVLVAGERVDLLAFSLQLSFSRGDVVVWSESAAQLAWLSVHNAAFGRLGGVPATLRVDNVKTAISHGAGAWGVINATYRRYAQVARFHVDACQPRSPEAKGKVERRILDYRAGCSPYGRHWNDVSELQAWSDAGREARWAKRKCPATGTSVLEAHAAELPLLGPIDALPEPFDLAVTRRVNKDCTIQFEGRTYSVPFQHVGREVEVLGCATSVLIVAGAATLARHPRDTKERILLDQRHFEGTPTNNILPPQPLGRMGKRLQEIYDLTPEARPLDLYAALLEVAR
jgi:transposase